MATRTLFVFATIVILSGCKLLQGGSRTKEATAPAFLHELSSIENFNQLAFTSGPERFVKYSYLYGLPGGDADFDKMLFQNSRQFEFHLDFFKQHIARYKSMSNMADYERVIFAPATSDEASGKEATAGALYFKNNYAAFSGPILAFSIYFRSDQSAGMLKTRIDVEEVARTYAKLQSALKFIPATNLAFIIPEKADYFTYSRQLASKSIPIVKSWEFFKADTKATTYNPGVSYGYLRAITPQDFEDGSYTDKDILIFRQVPLDLGPVSGIITAEPQVPHSHVIFRAVNQGVPDMYIPNALNVQAIKFNLDKLVKWEVKSDGSYTLTSADKNSAIAGEAEDYWRKRLPKIPDLVADVRVKNLYEWQKQGAPSRKLAATYGAKGTNFAILDMALRKKGFDRSSFDNGFLIPFSFYYQHTQSALTSDFCAKAQKKCQEDSDLACEVPMQSCQQHATNRGTLSTFIAGMVSDGNRDKMAGDPALRKQYLAFVRRLIRAIPLEKTLYQAIENQARKFPVTRRIRFRSSTNAEDIAGLNGAGLYESKSGCLGDVLNPKKDGASACRTQYELDRIAAQIAKLKTLKDESGTVAKINEDLEEDKTQKYPIEKAILSVFASLWTDRAFLSREYYRLNHLKVFMGILAQPSFVDETVNGVVITTMNSDGSMEANIVSQVEDISITNPMFPDAVPEQVVVQRDVDGKVSEIRYLSKSNQTASGATVISNGELLQLTEQLYWVTKAMREEYQGESNRYDIEFKFSIDRKPLIKQIRPL